MQCTAARASGSPSLWLQGSRRQAFPCLGSPLSCSRRSPHGVPWQRASPARVIDRSAVLPPAAAGLEHLAPILQEIGQSATLPHPGWLTGVALNTVVFTLGYKVLRKGLTPLGVANAWFLGATVFSAFGLGGFSLVCLYFLFGTLVTKVKLEQKQREGIAEARSGQRGPASVWGSGIAGTVCALAALITGSYHPWQVGFVASFASKLSDTVSSEIGKAYGKTTYLVTTFERVPRGTEGAVSAEGTAAGVVAALLFALVALGVQEVTVSGAIAATVAAVVANFFESYLGAMVQGRVEWLSNDLVNMIQISLAAVIAIALEQALQLPHPL